MNGQCVERAVCETCNQPADTGPCIHVELVIRVVRQKKYIAILYGSWGSIYHLPLGTYSCNV